MPALIAPIGPNPAAVAELLWFFGQRTESPIHLWLVLESARSLHYLPELLGPGRALDELRDALGAVMPDPTYIHQVDAQGPNGLPADEHDPHINQALAEPLWSAALAAQQAAGADPVWFALSGGRRRDSTAMQTMVYQLLGRPQDTLVDVRLHPPVAEGGTGFFFPSQARQELEGRNKFAGQSFLARDISVVVEELNVVKLRPLLAQRDLRTYADASLAVGPAVESAAPPTVVADMTNATLLVNGHRLPLSKMRFALYAVLLDGVVEGDPLVNRKDAVRIHKLLKRVDVASGWVYDLPAWLKNLQASVEDEDVEMLAGSSDTWSKLNLDLQEWARKNASGAERFLVPQHSIDTSQGTKRDLWEVKLPRERIKLHFG